jgi:hypothetical protein
MRAFLFLLVLSAACPASNPAGEGEGEGGGEGEGEGDVDVDATVARFAGLWAGPADSQSSLGDFVLMSMDHRVEGDVLFARGDLDADNAIRWWLWTDGSTLRFENGGFFRGFFRSDGCHVVEVEGVVDGGAGRVRFCADEGGCDHIDATFAFASATELTMTVVVDGAPHVTWQADRVEERDMAPLATSAGTAPPLPTLQVNASFPAVPAGADAWLVLTATRCGFTFSCHPSRSYKHTLPAGATTASFVVDEVHGGDYFAVLIVDNNGNFATAPFPDGADRVSVPDQAVFVDDVDGAVLTLSATLTPP